MSEVNVPEVGSRWVRKNPAKTPFFPDGHPVTVTRVCVAYSYDNGVQEWEAGLDSFAKNFEPEPDVIEPGSVWERDGGTYAFTFVVYEVRDDKVFGRASDSRSTPIPNTSWYADDYGVKYFRKHYKRKAV